MMLKVIPLARKREALEAMRLQIGLHCRSIDSMCPSGIERALNLDGIPSDRAAGLARPILHYHGNAGGSAAVGCLPDERYVQPQMGIAGLRADTGGKKDSEQVRIATHRVELTNRHDEQYQNGNRKDDQGQIVIR